MPAGYRASTGNNARLANAGKRARGGLDPEAVSAPASVPIHGDLRRNPQLDDWLGWNWSSWSAPTEVGISPGRVGLYRFRKLGTVTLIYIGQGHLHSRVKTHLSKSTKPDHPQAVHFSGSVEVSWVDLTGMATIHLLEHENDLIASHVLEVGRAPEAQFLG
jgi:hypothetical protein